MLLCTHEQRKKHEREKCILQTQILNEDNGKHHLIFIIGPNQRYCFKIIFPFQKCHHCTYAVQQCTQLRMVKSSCNLK